MKKIFLNWKFWLLTATLIFVLLSSFFYYRANRYKVLDRTAFSDLISETSEAAKEGFESQEQLSSYITSWADRNSLEYKIDKAGNIIFDTAAIDRKKNVSPTVIVAGLNYRTASHSVNLIASAAAIASADLESGRKTVIFVNDENSSGNGYKHLSKKLIGDKSKVIYLDEGNKAYISVHSFAESVAEISMPAKKEDASLDTAVKIHISGIVSKDVSPENSVSMPDPLNAFGGLLTRLKTRSIVYRVSDFSVGSSNNMYPDSLDACIMLNSYSVESFKKNLDKQSKDWLRDFSKDNPDLAITYEVIESKDMLPKKCYDAATSDLLAKLLYTITGNTYKFSENDAIPENSYEGDYSGVNAVMNLEDAGTVIKLRIMSQGYDDLFLDRIVIDNRAAAEMLECSFKETERYAAFDNKKNSLFRTFRTTYSKVHSSSEKAELAAYSDSCFTPCSYLAEKNDKVDVIHLRISKMSAANLTNTLMCYIKSKGNTFSL